MSDSSNLAQSLRRWEDVRLEVTESVEKEGGREVVGLQIREVREVKVLLWRMKQRRYCRLKPGMLFSQHTLLSCKGTESNAITPTSLCPSVRLWIHLRRRPAEGHLSILLQELLCSVQETCE